MKILVFSPYYPPHIGGLESHADEFNKYLSQKGVDVTVFTPRLPVSAPEFETIHTDVKIIRFPAFEIISNYPLPKCWSLKFWRLFFGLFKNKFDIVISRTRFFSTSLLALMYAKMKKAKWIHIEHGSDFVKSGGKLSVTIAMIYDLTFGTLVLKKTNIVIANSNASADFCKKLAKNTNCEVIYRGVEVEKIISAPDDIELKNKYCDSVIITFLGRLIDGKGVKDLLSSASEITDNNFKILVIGDGPERKNLENQTQKLKLESKVIFLGYKKFEDYIKILKISDIFINPSYTEGLPTTVAEAALCRNAIIATNVGGTPEIITNNQSGYLINPKDITTLKNKLEMLINNDSLRKELGNSAYNEVLNKFNWDKSIDKYLDIFYKLKAKS
ncbi:MAG: glycosyltransferase [Candidatus Moranbacteria bacterium CG_4_9_14_3_um_filter_42_9]|nr:MAG: glycosyltransferase [Candidatus Moranbacteria bacterium CG_4_9_14_3_um_filter_42_9]